MRSHLAATLFAALASCAAPPPPPAIPIAPPSAAPSAEAAAPRIDPRLASVTALARPAKLVVDGDIAEWGSLLPPPPDPKEKRDPKEPDPNPREASSRVAVAFTAEGVIVAAELHEAARDGVWLGVGVTPPATPPLGEYQRAGLGPFFECAHFRQEGEPEDYDPSTSEECKAVERRAAEKVAAHERRFRRVFRLDRAGVSVLDERGAPVPVEGAKIAIREAGKGATLEATLPLRALPRMTEAPVTTLLLAARSASTPASALPAPERWASITLPEKVGFEPWADLRAALLGSEEGDPAYYPRNASYHPTEPLRLETLGYPGETERRDFVARDGALYVRRIVHGDLEVGVAEGSADHLVVLRKGRFHAVYARRRGTIVDLVRRGDEVHVFQFDVETATDNWRTSADWTLWAIRPDGDLREQAVDEAQSQVSWVDPKPFHTPDFALFGTRGGWHEWVNGKDVVKGWERTWRWDAKKQRYLLRERGIPLPTSAKKRR